ncbi:HD domain-containing protein [bacterium]|nr:MAG: HD domain-containing protein [bacterium]
MLWLNRYPIRLRTFLLAGVGLALILASLVYFSMQAIRDSTKRALTERLSTARLVAADIDDHIADIFTLFERAATSGGFDLADADQGPERRTLRELYRTGIFSCQVFITDRRGVVLLTEPHSSLCIGEDRSASPYIAAALNTGRPQASNQISCPDRVSAQVGFVIPVKDQNGAVVGLLGGVTDSASLAFAGTAGSLSTIAAGHMDVVDADGFVLISTNPAFVSRKSHHLGIADMVRSMTATLQKDTFIEAENPLEKGIMAFAPLKNAPWGVIIAQAETVALAPVNKLRRQLTTFGVIFVVLSLLVTWLTTKAVLMPIQQLLTASRRIEEGDMRTPVIITGRDEIGELGRSFEAMRRKLAVRGEELEMAVRERTRELSTLFEVSQGITANLRLDDVLTLVAEAAPRAIPAERCSLFLWNEQEERLVLRASTGVLSQEIRSVKYRPGEGLAGWVFLENRSVSVPDVTVDPRWKCNPNHEQALLSVGYLPRNALMVPLRMGEKALGVLGLMNRVAVKEQPLSGAPFTPADESLLISLAGQTAIAIENARLYEDVRGLSIATIRSLATAIDARDPYTRGHSEEVAQLAVQIARGLGWRPVDIEMLEFAALLHDVGKIAVPDAILRKVEPLTPDEWSILRLHPYHSAQIIKPVEPLKRIVPWVYHHHERWDGKGYPDAVQGETIPLAARIIAVADTYNAMTTDRPYRKALSVAAAMAEIRRCAGGQFDPAVAEAFLRIRRDDATAK